MIGVQLASRRDIGAWLRACDYFGVGEPRRQGIWGRTRSAPLVALRGPHAMERARGRRPDSRG